MIKIAVDVYGGDNAPEEIVQGAFSALAMDADLSVVLVGKEAPLRALCQDSKYLDRIEIAPAEDVIGCDETPVVAIRRKKNASIPRMFTLAAEGGADGCVSAGSTGAVLAGGIFLAGRMQGVKRPGLCPLLPTVTGGNVLLVDCGANTDCKPEYLLQFAQMGVAYIRCLYGIENPRIGLLSNGAEDEKGNELIKETNALLRASGLNFVRNAEAREMLSGEFDIIVSDGFNGNIALKSAEGTAGAVFTLLKQGIASSFRAKLGAALMMPVLKKIKKRMDYTEHGGAALLGINIPLVKVHGSTKAKSMAAAILQCKRMVETDLVQKMKEFFHE